MREENVPVPKVYSRRRSVARVMCCSRSGFFDPTHPGCEKQSTFAPPVPHARSHYSTDSAHCTVQNGLPPHSLPHHPHPHPFLNPPTHARSERQDSNNDDTFGAGASAAWGGSSGADATNGDTFGSGGDADAANDDTFGSMGGGFSLEAMANMTAAAAGTLAQAAASVGVASQAAGSGGEGGVGLDDLVFSALDTAIGGDDFGIEASLGRLIMDDEPSAAPAASSTASGWGSFGLLTPDQVSKNATTKVAGSSISSIWGTIDKASSAAPAPASAAATATAPAKAAGPTKVLTLAEIEAKLRSTNANVPADIAPPPKAKRAPPGLDRTATGTASPATVAGALAKVAAAAPPPAVVTAAPAPVPTAAPAEATLAAAAPAPAAPAEDDSEGNATPILAQLQQAQGAHMMQQQLQVEQQRYGAHMQQLAAQLKANHDQARFHQAQAGQANGALMQMAQAVAQHSKDGEALPAGLEQQRLQLEQQRHGSATAAHEHQRRCHQIVQAQGAAEREFATRQTAIAIETGNGKMYRGMLQAQLEQLKGAITQTIEGFEQSSTLIKSLEARHRETTGKLANASPEDAAAAKQLIQKLEQQLNALVQRQGMVQQQQSALASQNQMIAAQLATVEASMVDKGNIEYNNLMAESEKRWLISIQARQMHSDNPYVDNFYFNAFNRKRAAMMQSQRRQPQQGPRGGPAGPAGPGGGGQGMHMPKRLGAESKGAPEYKPKQIQNTLGQLKSSNVRTPQAIMASVVRSADLDVGDDAGADDSKLTRELQEKARRRQALFTIEMAYRQLLVTEDLAYKLENHGKLGSRARQSIEGERSAAIKKAFELLQVPPKDGSADEGAFTDFKRILTIGKGRTLLQRLGPLLQVPQKHAVLHALLTLADALVTPKSSKQSAAGTALHVEHLNGLMQNAMPTVLQIVSVVPLQVLSNCIKAVAVSGNLLHDFGANILYAIGRRADALLSSGRIPPPQQKEWTTALAGFAVAVAPALGEKVAAPGTTPIGLLWELASLLAAHSDTAGKAALKAALEKAAKEVAAKEGSTPPPVQGFLSLVGSE